MRIRRPTAQIPMFRLSHIMAMAFGVVVIVIAARAMAADDIQSHAPTRPGPKLSQTPLTDGPKLFVDATRGDDANAGSETAPFKTLKHALRQLKPGDTLYLRGGAYYEHAVLTRSGTEDAPIAIAGYPGETAVIDGGLREFWESPETSWEPLADGAEGEFVSTKTYFNFDDRRVPNQFLPASWEPMWGIEEDRPIALGHFGDSLLPLHGYRTAIDLRAKNELWIADKKDHSKGVYCGPGLWFNRETGRVHVRLAHNTLPGLGERSYRGETDPRKLRLVVALGFGDDVLRVSGIKHVALRDLVFRGATGSPMINVYGSQHVTIDHVTVYGGFPALLVNASQEIKLTNSAFRGLAAPWTGRSHQKYRGTATYQIVLQNDQPRNENIEIAACEFTDDHDFAYVRFVKNLQFHHNYVDNFNDDGLECGAKLRDHTIFIHQNYLGACLTTFTQHEMEKDESPLDHDAGSGVYVYRNVLDGRAGVYYGLPTEPDESGAFLHHEGMLASDHGSPVWPVMLFYHNTLLRQTPAYRDNYLFGLGVGGLGRTERDVFNNIFVQLQGKPGVNFVAMQSAAKLREGGNILWGPNASEEALREPFARFRALPLFEESRKVYEAGWTTDDRMIDPKLTRLPEGPNDPADVRLQAGSPAIKQGIVLAEAWPDPYRKEDGSRPDIGAVPFGTEVWAVGIEGRMRLTGEAGN